MAQVLPCFTEALKSQSYGLVSTLESPLIVMSKSGFTLSELLIALAILGLIATFTIPKVLNSTDTASKQAVFKETLGMLSEIQYEAVQTGQFNNDFFRSKIKVRF